MEQLAQWLCDSGLSLDTFERKLKTHLFIEATVNTIRCDDSLILAVYSKCNASNIQTCVIDIHYKRIWFISALCSLFSNWPAIAHRLACFPAS